MKKNDFKKLRPIMSRTYWRLWCISMLLFCGGYTFAQTASWSTGSPGFPSTALTVNDDTPLDIEFQPLQDIPNATIEIVLPTGLDYIEVKEGEGHTQSITYTIEAPESSSAERMVTISFTSNDGKLIASQQVSLQVFVQPVCDAIEGTVKVGLYSNGSIIDDEKSIEYTTRIPVIMPQFTEKAIYYEESERDAEGNYNPKEVALSLRALDGNVSSFTVALTYSDELTLSSFQFDGKDISEPAFTRGESGSIVTLNITQEFMGSKLDENIKELTFQVGGNECGTKTIRVSSIAYPVENPCVNQTDELPDITLVFKGQGVLPELTFDGGKTKYVGGPDLNDIISNNHQNHLVKMDGITSTYHRVVYNNTTTAAHNIKQQIQTYRITKGVYNYVVLDKPILYSIDGGNNKVELSPKDITYNATLGSFSKETNRKIKSNSLEEMPVDVVVTIPQSLPAGSTLMIYYPIAGGDIYDNSGVQESTLLAQTFATLNWYNYNISFTNSCGDVGNLTRTYGTTGYDFPRIGEGISDKTYSLDQEGESEFNLYTGDKGKSLKINVKLPEWLTLDKTDLTNFTFDGKQAAAITEESGNTYSITIDLISSTYNKTIPIRVKYKSLDNYQKWNGNSKVDDKIRFWVDWTAADGSELKYFTQLYQNVQLVQPGGLILEKFSLKRTTIGWLDTDNDGIRDDDSSYANPDDIVNDSYLLNDEGEMIIEAHISEEEQGNYNHLYFMLSSATSLEGLSLGNIKASLNINNAQNDILIDIERHTENQYYLSYSGGGLTGDDKIILKIPFQVNDVSISANMLNIEGYVTNTEQLTADNICNPDPSVRHGDYKLGTPIKAYEVGFYATRATSQIDGYEPNFTFPGHSVFHGTLMPEPYFENEIRFLSIPQELVIEMPVGYRINSDLTVKIEESRGRFQGQIKTVKGTAIEVASGTIYTYDIGSLFDENYTDGSSSDKWPCLDDKYILAFTAEVQATKAAASPAEVKTTLTHKDRGDNKPLERNFNISYTGDRTVLEVTESVKVSGDQLVINPVRVTNPNGYNTNIWLYIEGPAKELELTDLPSTPIAGDQINGRWINLGEIKSGVTKDYSLSFTYDRLVASENKDIKIYTISNFSESGWKPDITKDLSQFNEEQQLNYIGATSTVTILPISSRISGEMVLAYDNEALDPENLSYQLTAKLDGRASTGLLVNPGMKITIPAGQKYVSGSVKVEYPLETINVDISNKLNAILENRSTSPLDQPFEFIFQIDGSFPGASWETDEAYQQAVLSARFTADACETNLSESAFRGVLLGENAAGEQAVGAGREMISKKLTVKSDYRFAVNVSFGDDKPVIYSGANAKALQVTITKLGGATSAIGVADSLQVTFDTGSFDLTGSVKLSSNDLNVPTEIAAKDFTNTESEGKRVIMIPLPKEAYDADNNNGTDKKVTFTLPLEYKLSDDDFTSNAEKRIEINVMSPMNLGCSEVGKPQQFGSLGEAELYVAVVRPETDPLIAYVGTEATFRMGGSGFAGGWYSTEDGSNPLTEEGVFEYTFTPSEANADMTYYVSAIFTEGNYGMIPVRAIIFPGMSIRSANICLGADQDLSELVTVTPINSDGFVTKYYSDEEGNNGLSTTVVTPQSNITYYVRQETTDGSYTGVMSQIVIEVSPGAKIRGVTGNVVAAGQPIDIVVGIEDIGEVDLICEFYDISKEGEQINLGSSESNTFRISESATTTDNGKRYRVIVKGDGMCDSAPYDFTLTVTSDNTPGTNPPSPADCRVTWDVSGNGSITVSANGRAIGNGDRLSGGTVIQVVTTAYGQDVLTSLTANGAPFEGSYTLYGRDVHIVAEFTGTDPNPDSNAEVSDGTRIWTEKGYVCLYTEQPSMVQIITLDGRLLKQQKLSEGETRILLPDGFYIAVLNAQRQKIAIRNY